MEALANLFNQRVPKGYASCDPDAIPYIGSVNRKEYELGSFITGDQGIGKTYFASALAKKMVSTIDPQMNRATEEIFYPSDTIQWEHCPYLIMRIKSTFNRSSKETCIDIVNSCIDAKILVIDDMCAEVSTEFTGETIYTIISMRRNDLRPTIITTNQTIDEINEWEPRIGSRMAEFFQPTLPNIDRRIKARA